MKQKRISKKKKIFGVIIGISFLFFAFYIFQVNSLVASAYATSNLERKLKSLREENDMLETSFAKNFAFSRLQDLAQKFQLEKVESVKYVQIISGTVAQGALSENQ